MPAAAVVRKGGGDPERPTRVTCDSCGYVKDAVLKRVALEHAVLARGALRSGRQDGRDGFGHRLWLVEECCGGHLLWAYNEPHLDYLERFIASTSRDRDFPSPPGNRGLSYKLPKWMQRGSNRAELLRAVARLRRRLA